MMVNSLFLKIVSSYKNPNLPGDGLALL